MMWEQWLAVSLATALALALLALPVAAAGRPSLVAPGASELHGNAGGAVRVLDGALQDRSPPEQQGITKAQQAISDAAQNNPSVQQHNLNVPLTPSPSSQP